MSLKIRYEPTDVWGLFQREKQALRTTMKQIAGNDDLDVVVYLTEEDRGDMMLPNIVVYLNGSELYEECAVNENDCAQTVKKVYYEYLTEERLINKVIESDENDRQKEMDSREDDLDTAVFDFLAEVMEEPLGNIIGNSAADEIYDDFKEHALEYLARKWGLTIYRPMILEDEDGEEFFEEYPYDVLEFEDEDNPIYKQ